MLEKIAKIRAILLGDGKMKLTKLVNIFGISKERVGHIIIEFLQMKSIQKQTFKRQPASDQTQKYADLGQCAKPSAVR